MSIVLINAEKKSDIVFLLSLTKKLGLSTKTLSQTQIKDWQFAQKIKTGMKSGEASRSEVMKTLEKN